MSVLSNSIDVIGHQKSVGDRATSRTFLTKSLALALAVAGMPAMAAGQPTLSPASTSPATLISSAAHPAPAGFRANVKLLIHDMPSSAGGTTRASTLLFTPRGTPPKGGWQIVAWAHGTTTSGQQTCAPSLTPQDLDGGLTQGGFKSDYSFQVGQFVNAGYAVVAPDLEGLGAVATVRHPYFGKVSFARSMIAGVRAAREADTSLASRWAVVGHSEGGHGALSVEAHAGEAPELTLVGTVASAPYLSIAAHAASFGRMARASKDKASAHSARVNEQFQVALMTVGLMARQPDYDPSEVMGDDLKRVLPTFRASCSVPSIAIIDGAIKSKGASFGGIKPNWAETPAMRTFLTANDLAVMPGFTLRQPTLVVQGTVDPLVLEPLTTAFVTNLRKSSASITYKRYQGADHFSIIKRANADVLAFLRDRFRK